MRAALPQKKKKEGSGTGPRARVESRQGAGKGEKKELSGHRWVPVSTASAGVDACIAWSNRTLGLGHCVSLGVSISQNYLNNNFSALAVLVHCAFLLFLASGPLLILALVPVPDPPPFFLLLGTRPPASLPRRANPLSPLFIPPFARLRRERAMANFIPTA